MFIPILLSVICIASLIVDLVLIGRVLQAITQKNSKKIKSLCNKLLLALVIGAGTLSVNTLLDVFEKPYQVTFGLIVLKLIGCIGPFLFGGGLAIYMFRKVAANIDKQ